MSSEEENFDQFCEDMEKFTDLIDQKRSLRTTVKVKGTRKRMLSYIKHAGLLYKTYWNEAESWITLPKAILYFLALTPLAITSFNGAMDFLNIPFIIPLESGSFVALILVGVVGIFGLFANRNLGLRKGHNALAIKQNANSFMDWKTWNEVKALREENKELKENVRDIYEYIRNNTSKEKQ